FGAGIYVTVNETDFRGRKAANITCVRAFAADLDGAPLANLKRFPLPPHCVTQTSSGRFQAYWRVDGASLEQFKPAQQRLAKLMQGDPTVCDLPRVMRLAGFPHQKDPAKPFFVTVAFVEAAPSSPYGCADFQAALAAAEAAGLKSSARHKPDKPASSLGA